MHYLTMALMLIFIEGFGSWRPLDAPWYFWEPDLGVFIEEKILAEAGAANMFIPPTNSRSTSLIVDGEIHYVGTRAKILKYDWMEIFFSARAGRLSGGFLDGPIERYHRTIGLPNGDRERFDQNSLRIQMPSSPNGDERLLFDRPSFGLFNPELILSFPIHQEFKFRVHLTPPTSTGSTWQSSGHWSYAGTAGWENIKSRWIYGINVLSGYQKPWVEISKEQIRPLFFGAVISLGYNWRFWRFEAHFSEYSSRYKNFYNHRVDEGLSQAKVYARIKAGDTNYFLGMHQEFLRFTGPDVSLLGGVSWNL
jgi:hypothetical protein